MDKELEKIMREVYGKRVYDEIYNMALKQSYIFWETVDVVFKTSRTQVFKSLYMTRDKKRSLLRKSLCCYVSEKTLYRRRREFVVAYKHIVEILSSNDIFQKIKSY